jgi:hypothetical protein
VKGRIARRVSCVVLASSLAVIASSAPAAWAARQGPGGSAPCAPQIIDLGTLGGANSEINGANRNGAWVGSADDAGASRRLSFGAATPCRPSVKPTGSPAT